MVQPSAHVRQTPNLLAAFRCEAEEQQMRKKEAVRKREFPADKKTVRHHCFLN